MPHVLKSTNRPHIYLYCLCTQMTSQFRQVPHTYLCYPPHRSFILWDRPPQYGLNGNRTIDRWSLAGPRVPKHLPVHVHLVRSLGAVVVTSIHTCSTMTARPHTHHRAMTSQS